jgi:hypothetical protein
MNNETMKTTLEHFTAEDRYGHDVFQGGTEASERFSNQMFPDEFWSVDAGKWVVGKSTSPFWSDLIYRRPLPLGNEAGKPPQWRLRGWREAMQKGDFALTHAIFFPVDQAYGDQWIGKTPAELSMADHTLRAVRCRISAEEPKLVALCAQLLPSGYTCGKTPGHAGPHQWNDGSTHWPRALSDSCAQEAGYPDKALEPKLDCLICTTPIYADSVQVVTVGGHKLHTACFERCASILTEHPKQLPVSGQWVLVKDELPMLDTGTYDVLQFNGRTTSASSNWIHRSPNVAFAWLRPYPRPEPPQVPVKDCCGDWCRLEPENKNIYGYCPFCGKEPTRKDNFGK